MLISSVLSCPADIISDQSTMENTQHWDSLKHMYMIIAIEEAFSVSFDEVQALEITSVELIKQALKDKSVVFG